jgi:protein-L-isoaspartate(D-aspartate) O-methyltransferase
LARLARSVTAVECDAVLAANARTALAGVGVVEAKVIEGPLPAGAPAAGPYDAILVNGAVTEVPPALLDQMKDGGRLAAILVDGGVGRATLWRRFGATFDRRPLFDADAPVLPGFARKAEFVF